MIKGKFRGTLISTGAIALLFLCVWACKKEEAPVIKKPSSPPPWVAISKDIFKPGEEIAVEYEGTDGLSASAWIGIVPSYVPHGREKMNAAHALARLTLGGSVKGVLKFSAPAFPGEYEIRFNDSETDGKEIASVKFTVEGEAVQPTLKIPKRVYSPGETIEVEFTAPGYFSRTAWVGIVPSSVEHGSEEINDKEKLFQKYLEGAPSGVITLYAPSQEGEYDIRMNDSDVEGVEVVSEGFVVKPEVPEGAVE